VRCHCAGIQTENLTVYETVADETLASNLETFVSQWVCRQTRHALSPFYHTSAERQVCLAWYGPVRPSSCDIISTTRSQAVARIADRTASQHLLDHVTSSVTWPFDSP